MGISFCFKALKPKLAVCGLMLLMLFCAAAQAASPAVSPSDSSEKSAQARTLGQKAAKSLKLQTAMPDGLKPGEPFDPDLRLPEPFYFPPQLARGLLWGAGALVLGLVLFQVYKNMQGRSRSRSFSRQESEIFASDAAAAARMDEAQLQADELARQGQFARAMHVLLLQSLGEMRRRLDLSIAASLTSREILSKIGLSPPGYTALADIIGRVEFTHFGEYKAGSDDYLACRRSFEALTLALGPGRAG